MLDSLFNPAGGEGFGILSLVTVVPLVGMIILLFIPKQKTFAIKVWANGQPSPFNDPAAAFGWSSPLIEQPWQGGRLTVTLPDATTVIEP